MKEYTKNLGKVVMTPKGAWSIEKEYEILDIVHDSVTDHAYISKQEVPSGVDLSDSRYWMPLNVSGYSDSNVITLNSFNEDGEIQSYTLEEAIKAIKDVGRKSGVILIFYNNNVNRLDITTGCWEIWQFNSVNIYDWENLDAWINVYYNYNKFVGWYAAENVLNKEIPNPDVGCYAFVGNIYNEAFVYRCDVKNRWTKTNQKAQHYIKVVFGDNVIIGENGNWWQDGIDTNIPVSVKGDNGLTPYLRWSKNNQIEYSYDDINWHILSDKFNTNIKIKDYVNIISDLPNNVELGTIYGVGPIYTEDDVNQTNPIYNLYVYTSNGWINNGGFNSISAGIVQELGDSETKIMSQNSVTREISKVNLYAYFAGGNAPIFSIDENNLKIILCDTELRLYDKLGSLKYVIDNYKNTEFIIPSFSQLVFFIETKVLSVIPMNEIGNYIQLLSVNTYDLKVIDGLLSKYYIYDEVAYIKEVENLKNKIQIYVDNRDSVTLEENTSNGEIYFTYSGNLVIRSSVKNRNLTIYDLADELKVSLVTSKKGITNCIVIPNINDLCYNALTGALEIVHRDSVKQEHLILIAGTSGVVIYVNQNLLNTYDFVDKIGIGFTSTNGQIPNINTVDKILDLGEDSVLYFGDKYYIFKELFPNNSEYYREIPIYDDSSNTGAIKLIFNLNSKRIVAKGATTPIDKNEIVIGGFRLVYETHDFVSANLPFNYTIDGKTLSQIETVNKQVNYIGERPNLPMRSEFRKLFSISTSDYILSTQGMDIYKNKFLFQGSNEPSDSENYNNIVIIDLDSRKIIGGFEYKKESHLNTINCGKKYNESDAYPLLYVSECYYEHACEVVRISNELTSYQVIQKITYNGNHFLEWSAYDWTIDIENSFIYAFGTNNGFTQILKFTLPSQTRGDVVLTDSDILDVIKFNGAYIYQGAKVINNQIYIPFGFDTLEYPAYLKVIDVERKKVISHIPLDNIGEPEAVALYKNNLVIVNHANIPIYTEIIL